MVLTHPRRTSLLLSTALTAVLALPARAQIAATASPQGGQVVAGGASIAQTAAVTAITQTSQRAVVDWQSFNIGSAHTVAIQQPSTQSMTLNRVVGPDPSVIAGRLTATGGVAIVNGSGVVFTQGAQVDVQTLVVSTANTGNANFMAGKLAFDQPGKPGAAVVNEGTITVKQAGLAALVAPSVRNTGVIKAKLGHVVLAGAEAATLDLYGDGLVSIDVTKQVTSAPLGADGKPVEALVTNTGTIRAEGGTVQLTAAAADGVVQNLISAGGTISVNGGRGAGGTITLAGVGGSMVIEGALSATGATGGTVQAVTDGAVSVAAGGRLNASGRRGGGAITLGGGQTASVAVAKGAVLKADATRRGNGGKVAVIARSAAVMNGSISARGGKRGGDGGRVEISAASVGITGGIDTSAPAGQVGTILLDPDDLTIVHAVAGTGAQDASFVVNGGTVASTDPSVGADTITDAVINAFAGNVRLQANQTITATNGVQVNLGDGVGTQSLMLEAGGTIAVAAGATLRAAGDLVLATGNAVSFTPPVAAANPLVRVDGSIGSTNGSVFVRAGVDGGIAVGAAGRVSVAASGSAVMSLVSDTLALTPGAQLSGATLQIAPATLGATVTLGGSGLAFPTGMNITTLVLGGATAPGGLAPVVSAGGINVAGAFAAGIGTLDLLTSGAITQSAALTGAAWLTGSAGSVALTNVGTTIGTIGSFTVAGALALSEAGSLNIAGPVLAGGAATLTVAGTLAVTGSFAAAGITLNAGSIELPGRLDAGALSLVLRSSRGIEEPGTILAASLIGSAGGTASLTGATAAANQIGTLGEFAAVGLSVRDGIDLVVAGTVDGSTAVRLDAGAQRLTVADTGWVRGTGTVELSAGSIVLAGTVSDGALAPGGGTVSLTALGDITQTGTLVAGRLTGSTGGSATLTGSNRIAALGNFATGADFFLRDGAVAAGASTLTLAGVVAAGTAAAAGNTPNTLEIDATGLLAVSGSLTSGRAGAGLRGGSVVLRAVDQPGGTAGKVAVTGSVAAVANGTGGTDTIAVIAPAITIGGTLAATSDLAHARPGLVSLQADTLSIGGTVSVPDGMVSIVPLSFDALVVEAAPTAGHLSLAPAGLQRIGVNGTGSGELVLGSADGATASVGTLALQAALALPGATTLGLFSRGDIIQDATAPLRVAALVGRAGRIALPAANAIASIGRAGLTASGDISLNNTAALSIIGPVGLVSGLGTAASGASLTLTESGALLVDGPLGNCGTGALRVSAGSMTLGVTTAPTLWSLGTASLTAAGALAMQAGVLDAAGIALGGTITQSGGVIASSGSLSLAGPFTQSAGTLIAAGALSQSTGTAGLGGVAAAGSASLGTTSVFGALTTGGDLSLAALTITAGTVAAGGALTVGGGFTQSGGTVLAGGDVTIGSTGTVVQSDGTLAAGGTLSLTAAGLAQGMGSGGAALISGGAAVRLTATSGDVRQGAWGTLASGTGGIAVQAPAGEVTVWHIATAAALTGGAAASQAFVCGAACAALPGAITTGAPVGLAGAAGRVNVALSGDAIALFADAAAAPAGALVLTAGTLSLASARDTTEMAGAPVIDALLLTGNAGGAVRLGGLTGGGAVAELVSNANRIATLGAYTATGAFSVADASALSLAGPLRAGGAVTLATAGALSVPGSIAGADVLLVANEKLLNAGTGAPAGLSITGSVLAPTGTLDLRAGADIVETGTLAAAILTGRAGLLAADTALPPNERVDEPGSITLTGTRSGQVSSNTLGSVGTLLATGGIALEASPTAATLTLAGPITAGYGGLVAAASVTVRLGEAAGGRGTLAVAGPLAVASAAGGIVLAASGDVTLAGATTPAWSSDTLILAPDSIAVFAGRGLDGTLLGAGAYTQSGGLVAAGGVSLSAPGGMILNDGLVLSTGAGGVAVPDGASTINGGLMQADGSGSIRLAAPTQTGGVVSANGSVAVAGALAQSGGTLAAAGGVALGALAQTAGTLSAGGSLTIGTGTGTAGNIDSHATSGSFVQTGGVLVASGDIAIWTTGTASQSAATLAAGGRVGLTAEGALAQSNAGLISGAGGVALLANGGNAAQDASAVVAGGSIIVQAPAGDVSFVDIARPGPVAAAAPAAAAAIACPSCLVPLSTAAATITVTPVAALAAPAWQPALNQVNVTLVGNSISIPRDLNAGTLSLYSRTDTQQTAGSRIDALVLNGGAGMAAGSLPAGLAALGWTMATPGNYGWTAAAGSAALGTLADPSGAVELGSNANRIAVLGSYATTGAFSLTDAAALAVTGAVQAGTSVRIGTAGAVSVTGTITGSNVLLLANENLFNPGSALFAAPADLTISGGVAAAGTLALWAERNLTASGAVAAALLTGRAGGLAADTALPANFRHDQVGSVALTGGNALATIGTVLAAGDIAIDTGDTVLRGPVVAGYGGLVANSLLDLQVAGDLTATGQIASAAAGGSATLAATGAITLTDALIFAPAAVRISAGGAYAQTGGTVFADTLTLAAPTRLLDGGTILSPGTGGAPGIDLSGGSTTITDAGIISAGGAATLVHLGALTLARGTVASAGALQADAAVQQAGTMVAVGNARFGSLQQAAGALLAVGGDLTVGTGSGSAGQVGSQAGSGAVGIAGSVGVDGTLSLWSAGSIALSGTVLAGRVRATAAGNIAQTAGTLVGGSGVALLSTTGNAVQSAGAGAVLAGGTAYDVAVRAPLGSVSFANITLPGGTLPAPPSVALAAPSLTCTACVVPLAGGALPASPVSVPAPVLTARAAGAGIPDVTLAGASIQQDPAQRLTAATLSLFAIDSINAQGTLVATTLTGSAGLAQPAQGLAATNPAAWVHLDGAANSIATLGNFTATGVLRLTDARALSIPGSTISAPLIRLLVANAITLQGGLFITGGEAPLPVRGQTATDPSNATYTDDSQRGLYLAFTTAAGQVNQTGLTQLQPIGALPALMRIDLPMGSANAVRFDPGLGFSYGLSGSDAAVFLHLGNGWASGNVNLGQLAVIYASAPAWQTMLTGTLMNDTGVVISGQSAAALATIARSDGTFQPNGMFQLNGCALTSTSCVLLAHDSVPVQSALRPISFGDLLDPRDDPDLLMPNVSDRDY